MVSLLQIFLVFAKIGAFTLGGGVAMIPLIQNEIVKRSWLAEDDFPDIIALAQIAPGLFVVNISIFAGYKLRGAKGSIAATAGSVLPSFLIILLIAILFAGYRDNPIINRIFMGIRPVVVALIAVPMLQMAKKSMKNIFSYLTAGLTLVLVGFLNVSPMYIILTVLVLSFTVAKYRDKKHREGLK